MAVEVYKSDIKCVQLGVHMEHLFYILWYTIPKDL